MLTRFTRQSLTILGFLKMNKAQIKTFAFLDLETTGLPSLENNRTRITEMTIVAIQSEHLSLGVIPRVQNKLSLCFNPQKLISSDSERITGLSNNLLEYSAPFTCNTVQLINNFLEHCPKPICLVAHNGNRFDYPILRAEIQQTGQNLIENILCIDSLDAFRNLHKENILENGSTETEPTDTTDSVPLEFQDGFDDILCRALDEYESSTDPNKKGIKRALEVQKINETTPKKPINILNDNLIDLALEQRIGSGDGSFTMEIENGAAGSSNEKKLKASNSRKRLNFGLSFKLVDVYQRLTNQEAQGAHQAENDVYMMAMCAVTLGDRFIGWANENSRSFLDIPAMVRGRRIGM